MGPWEDVRALGQRDLRRLHDALRGSAFARIRTATGLPDEPLVPCLDPDAAYLPVDGVTRRLHGDLPAMLMGGLASLLLQLLHPGAMAGVDQFSNYRSDPLGRLGRTAMFLGTVTFGDQVQAEQAIQVVRAVHHRVRGTRPDGQPFAADDPHLLGWVHAAEVAMFLAGYRAFGPTNLTEAEADGYVDEMARVALDLGVVNPPRTTTALASTLASYRPELRLTPEGKQTRNFVLRGVGSSVQERLAYATLIGGALSILPPWSRSLLRLPRAPFGESLALRPAAFALGVAVRWTLPPLPTASASDHRPPPPAAP